MTEPYACSEHWQAVDPERNVARDYRLTVSADLFGWTIVERPWGRIGNAGQRVRDSFPDPASSKRFVAAIRRRRESAKERIGVAYRARS